MEDVLEKYLPNEQLSVMFEIDNDGNFFGMPKTIGEGTTYVKGKIIDEGIIYAISSCFMEGDFSKGGALVYYENFKICDVEGVNFSTQKVHTSIIGQDDKQDRDKYSENSKIIYGLLEKYEQLINDIKNEECKENIIVKYNLDDFNLETKNKSR